MKIQINSLEAINRLIGGDTELEIQVRNTVIQAFADKYLKSLANSDAFKGELNYISEGIIKESIKKNVITAGLNGRIATALNNSVAIVERECKDETLVKEVRERIDKAINKAVSKITEELSNAILTKRIDKLVDEKIKAKLLPLTQ